MQTIFITEKLHALSERGGGVSATKFLRYLDSKYETWLGLVQR